MVDLLNGSYSVRFLLPWVGEAQVAVRLIHSSEAVEVLKHHRDTDSDRVFFNGFYEGPGPIWPGWVKQWCVMWRGTIMDCSIWELETVVVEYNDPRTGETWRCQRPKLLPCSARMYQLLWAVIETVWLLKRRCLCEIKDSWLILDLFNALLEGSMTDNMFSLAGNKVTKVSMEIRASSKFFISMEMKLLVCWSIVTQKNVLHKRVIHFKIKIQFRQTHTFLKDLTVYSSFTLLQHLLIFQM